MGTGLESLALPALGTYLGSQAGTALASSSALGPALSSAAGAINSVPFLTGGTEGVGGLLGGAISTQGLGGAAGGVIGGGAGLAGAQTLKGLLGDQQGAAGPKLPQLPPMGGGNVVAPAGAGASVKPNLSAVVGGMPGGPDPMAIMRMLGLR